MFHNSNYKYVHISYSSNEITEQFVIKIKLVFLKSGILIRTVIIVITM